MVIRIRAFSSILIILVTITFSYAQLATHDYLPVDPTTYNRKSGAGFQPTTAATASPDLIGTRAVDCGDTISFGGVFNTNPVAQEELLTIEDRITFVPPMGVSITGARCRRVINGVPTDPYGDLTISLTCDYVNNVLTINMKGLAGAKGVALLIDFFVYCPTNSPSTTPVEFRYNEATRVDTGAAVTNSGAKSIPILVKPLPVTPPCEEHKQRCITYKSYGKRLFCSDGAFPMSGGGKCGGAPMKSSKPIISGNGKKGWEIECGNGSNNENCEVYAVCCTYE